MGLGTGALPKARGWEPFGAGLGLGQRMGTQKRSLLVPSLPTHSRACWMVSGKLQASGAHLPFHIPPPGLPSSLPASVYSI